MNNKSYLKKCKNNIILKISLHIIYYWYIWRNTSSITDIYVSTFNNQGQTPEIERQVSKAYGNLNLFLPNLKCFFGGIQITEVLKYVLQISNTSIYIYV